MEISKFFSKLFYIAVLLITLGYIFSQIAIDPANTKTIFVMNLLSSALKDIGLAVLISNIFSFILGTDQFLQYIREKLMNIVISKEFITTLKQEEQFKLLQISLKPSKDLSLLYSGINNYFNQYIEQSMKLFDSSYRGHLHINAEATFNEEKGCIQILCDMDYIVYKVTEKFESLPIFFEEENSKYISTTISGHQKKTVIIDGPNTKILEKKDILNPNMNAGYTLDIPDEFNDLQQININRKFIEYGYDHWQAFSYKSLKPYDGMIINLKCAPNITIKSYHLYGKEEDFTVTKDDSNIKIQYHDWLTPGFGVNIIVSKLN